MNRAVYQSKPLQPSSVFEARGKEHACPCDEHGSLYEISPFLPVQYKSLRLLGNFHFWTEENRWARLLLTSTAQGRFESQVLDPSYRHECVEYVGPVSKLVFSRLLALYPGLSKLGMIDEMAKAANRVPRELRHLADFL